MRRPITFVVLLALAPVLPAGPVATLRTERLNDRLKGRVVAFTHRHGDDRRIPSAILGQNRDLYLYLPPGHDPCRPYPLLLWMHGGFGDERIFVKEDHLEGLERLIARGCCPPFVIACPDLTLAGKAGPLSKHSLGVNGVAGRFEDHLMQEVVPFVLERYRIEPDRRFHAIGGRSAGGFAAMSLALKHRAFFGCAFSVAGALDIRYGTVGGYREKFTPQRYRPRVRYDPEEYVGSFLGGLVKVRAGKFLGPVFGGEPGMLERVRRANPADLLDGTDLQPGELALYVEYGLRDQLNMDAQSAAFVWRARGRGVEVEVYEDAEGTHGADYFAAAQHRAYRWLGRQWRP